VLLVPDGGLVEETRDCAELIRNVRLVDIPGVQLAPFDLAPDIMACCARTLVDDPSAAPADQPPPAAGLANSAGASSGSTSTDLIRSIR
jgi:hypothetical protein